MNPHAGGAGESCYTHRYTAEQWFVREQECDIFYARGGAVHSVERIPVLYMQRGETQWVEKRNTCEVIAAAFRRTGVPMGVGSRSQSAIGRAQGGGLHDRRSYSDVPSYCRAGPLVSSSAARCRLNRMDNRQWRALSVLGVVVGGGGGVRHACFWWVVYE